MSLTDKAHFMHAAIKKAEENFNAGKGGPFGAVVVKNGTIVSVAGNCVTSANDPTAHAEVVAIREACKKLGTFDLSGCEVYSSCEPCPMCLSALMWARVERLYYAADRNDAALAGFDDELFYSELAKPAGQRSLKSVQLLQDEAVEVFCKWNAKEDKIRY